MGQEAIFGKDFRFPAGIRLDLVDGTLCLPDKVRMFLEGRRPPYGIKIEMIMMKDQHEMIPVNGSMEITAGTGMPKDKQ